jgi:PAS domain S-box-containing protein
MAAQNFELKVVDPGAEQSDLVKRLELFTASVDGVALLTSVLNALPMAVYTTDPQGRLTFYNGEAAALWGREPEIGSSVWCGSVRLYWPDGTPMPHDKSAMATALSERRAISGAEAIVERPDGTRVHFLAHPRPLFDGGKLIGGVNMLVQISEDRPSYFEQRLAAIVECSDDAIISKDSNGVITTWNKAAERLFGYTAEEAVGRPVLMLIPSDRQQEESAILDSIHRGNPVARYETWRQRKDGTLVPIALTVSPLRDNSGKIVGASKIARDISDQVRLREHQALVLHEMSHRIKNVLAVAGGLVGLSARSAQSPKAMAKAVQERLGAYSRAHELTRSSTGYKEGEGQTTLHTLIHAITAPYVDDTGDGANITVEGDDVVIDSNATASLALLLHEFTTNAAKHGALSVSGGKVRIVCRGCDEHTEVEWTEHGGPRVSGPPSRQGFGSVLASRTVEGQLNGTIRYDWQPEGLVIGLKLPRDGAD